MFQEFTIPSYEEWISRANLETQKIESIKFPFRFNLDGLSLSAINFDYQQVTPNNIVDVSENFRPLISIYQTAIGSDTNWVELGIEDILLDNILSKSKEGPVDNKPIEKLTSMGVIYQPNEIEETVHRFSGLYLAGQPRMTFYPSLISVKTDTIQLLFPDCGILADIIRQTENNQSVQHLGVRGDEFTNLGVPASEELAIILSIVVYYWDKFTDMKISNEQLLKQTEVTLGLSGEFYIDLIKIRAARTLIHSLTKAFGISDTEKIKIRAVSGLLNKSLYDPDANLLRSTTEALSATLAGADIVTLRTHDLHYQTTSNFGRRMATNIQNLMRYESHLHRVANPVDGSYFFENATQQLVGNAWQTFLDIEKKGGIETYMQDGSNTFFLNFRDQKKKQLLNQVKKRVGVTRYTNVDEKINQSAVNQDNRQYSLTNEWEESRLRADQNSPENRTKALILVQKDENNPIVSARITFIIDLLNSLGVDQKIVALTEYQQFDPSIIIFCADDNWYQQQIPNYLNSTPLNDASIYVVGSGSLLNELANTHKINGVLNSATDLSPLLQTIKQLNDHEA